MQHSQICTEVRVSYVLHFVTALTADLRKKTPSRDIHGKDDVSDEHEHFIWYTRVCVEMPRGCYVAFPGLVCTVLCCTVVM